MAFGGGGSGPIASAFVEILANPDRADREIDALITRLRNLDATITVNAEARDVTSAVNAAVEAADTDVVVDGEASDVTTSVDSAVDAADTDVQVTGDAAQLTGEIDSSIDAADTEVLITGATEGLADEIDAAIDAADTNVVITGQVEGITGEIDSAVDAADTHVTVTGDSSGIRQATNDVGELNGALIASTASGLQLRSILQLGGWAAAAGGIGSVVLAAAELEQAVGGTEAVFGAAGSGVSNFAQTAAESAGLTEESARTLTSQLGGLLQGMGFTESESAQLSVTLAQLGADLAATFGGTSQEAVQALGAAIRGETDPIERYGISLNQAAVGAKAVELGLASSADEMSINARAQATLAILTERSANAQGQFAREANTTSGQLERARAEIGNAAAAIGRTLQPSINDLIGSARKDLIPAIRDLAIELGPALASTISALSPALGSTATLLGALAPVATGVATAIDAIPDPVLQAIAMFVVLKRTVGLLSPVFRLARSGLERLVLPAGSVAGAFNSAGGAAGTFRARMGQFAAAITPGTLALTALTLGLTAYANAQAKKAQQAAELEAQERGFQEAMTGSEGAVEGLRLELTELINTGADFESSSFVANILTRGENFQTIFSDAGATVNGFTNAVQAGQPAVEAYLGALARSGGEEARQAVVALQELARQQDRTAEGAVRGGIASNQWSHAQAEAAVNATRAADGSKNYVAALELLQLENTEAGNTAANAAIDLARFRRELPQMVEQAGLAGPRLSNLALALAQTGRSSESIQTFVEGAAAAIGELSSTATSHFGSISQTASEWAAGFDLSAFELELNASYDAISSFAPNIQQLVASGFGNLAQEAIRQGPAAAQAMVDALREGRGGSLREMELLAAGVNQNLQKLPGQIEQNGYPIINATGQLGALGRDAFGAHFDMPTVARNRSERTSDTLRGERGRYGAEGQALGQSLTGGFGSGAAGLPRSATNTGNRTNTALANLFNPFTNTGRRLGAGTVAGYDSGSRTMPKKAEARAETSRRAVGNLLAPFTTTGRNLGTGQTTGYDQRAARMQEFARNRARAAHRQLGSWMNPFRSQGTRIGQDQVSGYDGRARGMRTSADNNARAAFQRLATHNGAFRKTGRNLGDNSSAGIRSGMEAGVAPGLFTPFVKRKLKTPIENAFNRAFGISSPARAMIPIGRHILEGVMVGMSRETGTMDKLIRNIPGLFDSFFGSVGPGVGGGVGRWRNVALAALRLAGQPAFWVNDLLKQMSHESGGNPRAVNRWDVNAQRGTPSMGLMQTIGPTFAAYAGRLRHRGIFDPLANIFAAIRYTLARYGDLGAWRRRGFKGYEQGTGYVPRTDLYTLHRGEGVLPAPVNAFLKRTGFPTGAATGPSSPTIEIAQLIVNVPQGVSQPTIYGSRVAKGITRTLREQKVRVDARTG